MKTSAEITRPDAKAQSFLAADKPNETRISIGNHETPGIICRPNVTITEIAITQIVP